MKSLFKKNLIFPLIVSGIYLFLYLPIIILIIFSFNKPGNNYNWNGFTLHWYNELFQSKEIWIAFLNSLITALTAMFLSVNFGVLLVWGLRKWNQFLISMFYTTMLIPDVVIAVGLLILFGFFSIPLSLNSLIVAHTLLGLGFVVPIVYSRFLELDQQVIEASLDLGASDWQTFIRVVLPFLKPALVSAALSVFIFSLDDFLFSFFCVSSSLQTLPIYIFAMIRSGASPVINALSTFILVLSSLLVLSFSFIRIRSVSRKI